MAKITKKPAKAPVKKTAKATAKKTTPRTSLKTPKKAPARAQKAPSPRTRTTATPTKKTTAAKSKSPKTTMLKATKAKTPKRPPNNPDMPQQIIEDLNTAFNAIKGELENYAAHLRSLDRKRLNGVGIKTQGFIQRALEYAEENPEFLPHYLTLEKFQEDFQYFTDFRTLFDLCKQIQEILWNITIQSSDIVYTDALEFYASVREAAKRRVDAAETIYKDLEIFFKRKKALGEEPTEKKLISDAKAIAHGKRDGKIVIENIKPKLTGGVHKVIDEKFTDTAQFKETEEGEITE